MSWEFHVGMKVVCVDDARRDDTIDLGEIYPVKNTIYTVRSVDGDGIQLVEIINQPRHYIEGYIECDFHVRRFRPLETKSIKLFRSIAQGVTDGKPIVPDEEFDPVVALMHTMFDAGRPII